jgi:hypothetical protein
MPPRLAQSIRAFLVIMLLPVIVKIALTVLIAATPGFRSPSQTAIFAWPSLAILTAVGVLGVSLAYLIALPLTWDSAVPRRERLARPALLGVLMGIVAVAVDLATGWTKTSAAAMNIASIHIAWPQSLLIYPGGAVIVNIIYYLVPIPLVVWLITRLVKNPAHFDRVFWSVAFAAALVEPVTQSMGNGLAQSPLLVAAFGAQDFVANLLQVRAFKRAGFGATVVFRVAFYLIWHVAYGLTGA